MVQRVLLQRPALRRAIGLVTMVTFTFHALYILQAPLTFIIILCLTVLLITRPVPLLCLIQCNTVPLQVKKTLPNLFSASVQTHMLIECKQHTFAIENDCVEFSVILQNIDFIVLCAWLGFHCYFDYVEMFLKSIRVLELGNKAIKRT